MNTTTTLFLRSDPAMYVCVSRRSRPCPYVRTWPYLLSCTLAAVRTCTCYVRASTSTSMYVHIRDQNDNARYASTGWVPTVRHFLACEDVAGGSQQSGGRIIFFARTHFLACEDVARGSQQSGGRILFFTKYGGPSGGSPLSGGGIIILRVIRRHFLAAVVDPAVSLSTYSTVPMEVGR